jgi:hypothetical protein
MIRDQIPLRGHLTISLNNRVVQEVDNMVVDGGASWVANRMLDAPAADSPVDSMQVGSGTADPEVGDTGLTTLGTSTAITTVGVSSPDIGVQFSTTFVAGEGSGAITEAGLFAGAAMVARTKFAVVNKGAADELAITWTIKISNGT